MNTKRQYKSEAMEAVHSSARALLDVGAIDKTTMRHFDESCLVTVAEIKPKQIKEIREKIMSVSRYSHVI